MSSPVIILVEPQMGENIGAAARAMLNCGLTRMRLVRPRDGWPNPKAQASASGADKVIGSVQDALGPAIETAKLVLDKLKDAKPGEVTVTFGLKVSGKLDWFVARAATSWSD